MVCRSGKLAQVCYNIIENAIKYTPDGGTITVSLAKVGRDAVLDISDTGVGIPAEDLPHVFDGSIGWIKRVPARRAERVSACPSSSRLCACMRAR